VITFGVAEAVENIEAYVARVRRDVRAALSAFLSGGTPQSQGFEPISRGLCADDFGRYAAAWAWLAPTEPAERERLRAELAERYPTRLHQVTPNTAIDALEQAAEYLVIKGRPGYTRRSRAGAWRDSERIHHRRDRRADGGATLGASVCAARLTSAPHPGGGFQRHPCALSRGLAGRGANDDFP
jgi:hypothetical protein